MAPLKSGDKVKEKAKPYRCGKILHSQPTGATGILSRDRHRWIVEFTQSDGTTVNEEKTSKQLNRARPEKQQQQPQEPPQYIQRKSRRNDKTPPAAASRPISRPNSPGSSQNTTTSQTSTVSSPLVAPSDVHTSFSDHNSEAGVEVSIGGSSINDEPPAVINTAEDQPNPNEPTEDIAAGEADDQESEEVYKQKRIDYEEKKAQLLEEGWTVEIQQDSPPFGIGSKVKTKAGRNHNAQRQGTIVGKAPDEKKWMVQFDDTDSPEQRAHQALILVVEEESSKPYIWKLVENSEPNDEPREYDDVGLSYFNFKAFTNERVARGNLGYAYPYLQLFMKMWPGDWKQQLRYLNEKIELENAESKRKKKKKHIRKVSEHEWWKFIGIIVVAAPHKVGGESLWEKDDNRTEWTMTEPINYGKGGKEIMPEYRFKDIKSLFPWAFQDKAAEARGDDPWHMIRAMVDGYNENRTNFVCASIVKVLDESMSAWRARTTKTGGLPHLSLILRKPEPLGTEFKTVACAVTGILLHLEIQEGKLPMRDKKYSANHGGTAGCTLRMVEETQYSGQKFPSRQHAKEDNKREYYKGDSWFSSVRLAEEMDARQHAYCGTVKTSSKYFPKDELEAMMADFPSGASLVMECTTPRGHDLLAIGYKYNSRKVLLFVSTKTAGSTELGEPYIAKFNDKSGNVCQRPVDRLDLISKYFGDSNVIDSHNQTRQGTLKLEKRWVTQDCWFRLNTSLIGMTTTDCWLAYKHGTKTTPTIFEFADRLAADLIRNKLSDDPDALEHQNIGGVELGPPLTVDVSGAGVEVAAAISPMTIDSTIESLAKDHKKTKNTERQPSGRIRRRVCRVDGCNKETPYRCGHPICLQFRYNNNGKRVQGMFYCDEHWPQEHWKDVRNQTYHNGLS